MQEENYFFRMSTFQEALLEHIEKHPRFILPESRKNEVVSFIKQGLRDVCISRQNPGWGIPVPGDEKQVAYVWFDALINYVAATGWPDAPNWQDRWPADVQFMGKDILTRFHATLWPAMLMGVGLPLPDTLFGHAWMLIGGEKISKSKGNVVAPLELAQELAEKSGCAPEVAVDAVRYYSCTSMPYEQDTVFTYEDFDLRYNTDLANDLGNALNRSLAMSHKFVGGIIPDAAIEEDALAAIAAAKAGFDNAMFDFHIDRATSSALGLIRFLNKYIDTRAPWALAKNEDPSLASVMRSMLLCLRSAEGLLRPVMPATANAVALQLGLPPLTDWSDIGDLSTLPAGTVLAQPQPIFPRLDLKKAPAPVKEPKPPKMSNPEPAPVAAPELISIEDFAKVQLRVARIVEAEPLEGSDKLLKLQVMIGDEKRQIVAGIRKDYDPLDLIGRQIIVVANLKPAKLRGVESQGMLLAASKEDGGAILLQPESEAPEGGKVR
ncbi:methionine--tRNA ligase [soil metagenome]